VTTSNKRQLASGISVFAIAASLVFATPAHAQITSSLQGHAAPGATVTATDVNTGHGDSVKADASGNYNIVGLPPSTYRVQSGSAAQTVVVPLGQAVTVDLVGPAPAAGGAIVVVGARTRDVKTPTVTTNVSRFQIENLPNGDRNFLNFAALAPGVTVSPPTLGGNARQVQAGALASDFTNTFIDGISIKNLVNHGGTLGQNFSSGNPFPASAVDQFNVETQNFKAEFEQAASAVISSVSKTGGNKFHGEIFGEWQPKAFISLNYDDRAGNANNASIPYRPKPDFHTRYYGGNLGGPIIPGKLTFFADVEATDKVFGSNDINVYNGTFPGLSAGAQAYAQTARTQYNGSFPASFKEQLYFGKLTWFATPDDTVNVSAFIRHESNLQINGGIRIADASARNRNNEHRYQAWWNHRGSNWLNEFIVARDTAANGQIPNLPGSDPIVTFTGAQTGPTPAGCITVTGSSPNAFTCPNIGNQRVIELGNNFEQDDHQYQLLFKDNVTITTGDHTVKFGGKLNFTKLQRLEGNNVTGTYFYDAANFTGVGSSTPYAATINTAAVRPVTAKNTQIGLFVQDDWRPDDHWQVSGGLRWDFETNAKNENFVTPADVAAALRAYPGWKAAGINPDDFISTGNNRHPFYGAFQPRLGISYDVHGDRDLVFTLGAGRYYDRSLFIDSALETIKDYYESVATIRTCAVAPGPGCVAVLPTDPDALRALGSTQGGEVFLLNNHLKTPFSDEVTAGLRKRFGSINTSIAVSYIKSHNIFQYVVGNRLPDGSYSGAINPVIMYNGIPFGTGIFFGGGAIGAAPLPGHGNIFITNTDGKATYAALYLTADKPYTAVSGWGFSSTLTISRSRSNDGAGFGDPFWFDTPNVGDQGWQPSRGLERWRFVGTGTVGLPWDIRLSTVVTLSSGPSFGSVVCCNVPQSVAGPGGPSAYFTDFGVLHPRAFFGYKNVDFNISKSFKMPWNPGHELTVYFQALNAFDFINRNYSMWGGGFQNYGGPGPTRDPDPTGVASQGQSFKVGAKFTF